MYVVRTASKYCLFALSLIWCTTASGAPADLANIEQDGSVIELRTGAGTFYRVSFLGAGMMRVQATSGAEPVGEGSEKAPIVLPLEPTAVAVQVREESDSHVIATTDLELVVYKKPLHLELRRRDNGLVLWRELKPLAINDESTTQTLDSSPTERFFGGGQQNGTMEFKGRLMEISYSGGWEEGDRPSPAPIYMSDRGYGVLRNTWADGTYDFRSAGYLTATHDEARFDAYYLVGETVHEVLDLYTQLTGRARLLPRWAMGYGDADCYNDGDNVDKPGTVPEGWSDGPTGTTPDVVASVAAKYREHDMPGGWILPNDGYGCGYTELADVVSELGKLGFRTGLWTENGVEKIAWEVGTAGTRVQKLDVAWTGKGYQWALDANHDAAQGILDNSNSRPFLWTVMGWAGMQRYAVTWTGDQSGSWDYIRWHVPTLVGSGLSGMNYSTGDVDGIFGGSPDTFTRDLQWKCFTPVLMGMSGWSKTERKHPWWFDEPHRSINRRYLKLRQRLMPYIYTLARETEQTGAPMVRGIMWDHPADPQAYNHPYQFFLGRELLVAPVYRSETASGGWREGIYLPEGRWIDYWNGNVVDAGPAGLEIDVPVDLATLPVFVRSGAIIPMYPESLYDGQVAADPLTLDIYPAGTSEYVLYEDDGNTRAYQEGEFSQQRFVATTEDDRIAVDLDPVQGNFAGLLEQRSFELQLHTRVPAATVGLDGESLRHLANAEALSAASSGWHYDPDELYGVIRIKTGRIDVRAAHQVVVALAEGSKPAPTGNYAPRPEGDGTVGADALLVVGRAAEEPGHPLENAFDGNPDTWFRTVRDQSVAYGPHEFVLALGGRRVIEGFRLSPRNDKYWEYGQVRDYEVYLADVNGQWGEPINSGRLQQVNEQQEVRFAPRAGRLVRFRVLSTHDDGADPMVTGATAGDGRAFDALAPVQVGPTTISEFRLLERRVPQRDQQISALAAVAVEDAVPVTINGLKFADGMMAHETGQRDFKLNGDWQKFSAEAGIAAGSDPALVVRFQVWGDDRLLWDSGSITGSKIVKPRLDIRGVAELSLRTIVDSKNGDAPVNAAWAEANLQGFAGDSLALQTGRTPEN